MIKSFTRSIKNNRVLRYICNNLLYIYLRLLFWTYRLEIKNDLNTEKSINKVQGIFYFWHQNMIAVMFFFFKNKSPGYCVVSSSNDGKIIGFISKKLGFKVIWD